MVTTMTSREFNQDTGGAKRAAEQGPVFITDRGRTAHVLLKFADYERLLGGESWVDRLGYPDGIADIEFDPPRFADLPRPVDLD